MSMTRTGKLALRQTAEKAQEHGVFNMDIHSETVLALLDENSRLMTERDALREGMEGSSTRLAADIYFQLIEECEIPPGGSLVEHIDNMKERIAEPEARTLTVKLPRDCEHDVMAPIAAFMLNDGYEFDGEDYASLSGRVRNEIETVLRRTLRIAGIALDTAE